MAQTSRVSKVTTAPELTLYEGYARLIDKYLVAPCDNACPFHVPAQAYVRLVAQERFQEAYEQITSKNPLQYVCGYVCNFPCETDCTRGLKDEPIRIRAIKRFVMDLAQEKGWKPAVVKNAFHGTKVAVIGSNVKDTLFPDQEAVGLGPAAGVGLKRALALFGSRHD